jgi:hypothetical protein
MKMKFTTLCVSVLLFPAFVWAQCSCASGTVPDTITYTANVPNLSGPSTYIYFPKLDPSVGTLVCVSLTGTVNTIQSLRFTNRELIEVSDYLIEFARTTKITGPGISKSALWDQSFGPFALSGNPGALADSTILIGPDTPFNNTILSAVTSNVVPYQGISGNVQFVYSNTGSATVVQGSNNYAMNISTVVSAKFKLTYYVCGKILLPNLFSNIQLTKDSKNILLRWSTLNDDLQSSYLVEVSKNGKDYEKYAKFAAIGNQVSDYSSSYPKTHSDLGKLYFRIAVLNADGSIKGYSSVKIIQSEDVSTSNFQIYPNPIQQDFNLVFNTPVSGVMKIDLYAINGVLMESNLYKSLKQYNIPIQLKRRYAGGQYIIRLTNTTTQETVTKNILIQ